MTFYLDFLKLAISLFYWNRISTKLNEKNDYAYDNDT